MIELLLRRYFKGMSATSVLDIGPGYADFSRLTARLTRAAHITFVDNDARVLDWQKTECEKERIAARFISAGIEEEAVQFDSSYDIIHCQEILEHLSRPDTLLRELARRLAANGQLIITVPTKASERWLKFLDPSYMNNEPHGHVTEFNRNGLVALLNECGLTPRVFIPTQPHYFVAHTWMSISRMRLEGSSGRVLTTGWRASILRLLTTTSRSVFVSTGMYFWGRLLPRNYFVIATKVAS